MVIVYLVMSTNDGPPIELLKEVSGLPRDDLRAYIFQRATRIARETPHGGDWDDAAEWAMDAAELAPRRSTPRPHEAELAITFKELDEREARWKAERP